MSNKKKKKNKNKRNQLYFILAALVCFLIVFGIIIYAIITNNTNNTNKVSDKNDSSKSYETSLIQTEVQYVYDKPTDLNVNLADKTAAINYVNSSDNNNYLEYSIDFQGKIIFKSDRLSPGETIETVKLDLPADINTGEYVVTISIDYYDSKTATEPDTGLSKKVKLNIQ